ncbi:hypothetical protein A2V47_08825 [Candidatus Atribacteria bacterium RBG_19FT_COMBO_35_14]|uniref:Uncharacterized protein n=1 Tax=Candidatus Sediminicultor quintus TaxID=1797291 RepID=A0A1F5A6G6_9BACT|nr:MAG: hypothetical protein A2V47_08825 [Candidatus Atribacteria bacterium RBG_19FT_COMBO_35_14]
MIFKKVFSLILIITYIFTSVIAQFSWAAEASQATLLQDLSQVEAAIYGITQEKPLVERVEYLETELVGRTLPGTITNRVKQLKEFIISGTPEDPSLLFKINTSQWILEEKITSDPLIVRIENLENVLFGKTSDEVLAMRAENIFSVCFKEGKPQLEEILIPAGTLVPIRFLSTLNSKNNKTGEIFDFQISENVFLDNKLIIPVNSKGIGEITQAKKATILSRPGKLEIEFKSVSTLGGTSLSLILGEEAEEENKRLYVAVGAGILGLIILSSPVGLIFGALVPGKNVKIEEGTEMFLQVKEDITVINLVQ